MPSELLKREDVVRVLGEVDESIIAELISTHATCEQLATAVERLRDESFGWTSTLPPDDRVLAVYEVLQSWWQADSDPEYLGTD